MKPKIAALLLLALLIALVGVIPAVTAQGVAGDHPPTPAAPAPAAPPRPYQGQPGPIPSAPDAFTVSGKVTDNFGQPVPYVGLDAYNTETWDYYTTTTNDSGNYSFSLSAGDYELYPSRDRWIFKPEMMQVTVGPNKTNRNFEAVDANWQAAWYNAIGDAYTNQGSKNTNYGSAPILRVKNAASDMNAYVKFYVDGFSSGTESGTCYGFTDGWLTTYVKEPGPDGGGVYRVDNNWSENTLNWNNAPAIAGDPIGQFNAVTDESSGWAWLRQPVNGDGTYSFAIRNNSSNSIDYSSWEGGNYPWLVVNYRIEYKDFLTSSFTTDDWGGLAPFTVQFTENTYGCATSWHWDFGDGNTSTEPNPSHTYTSPGNYDISLTVSNAEMSHTSWYRSLYVAEPVTQFYISPGTNATIGGIPAQAADVLLYDKPSNTWTMVYDGSAHNTLQNVTAVDVLEGTGLLLTFGANQTIPGLGTATPYDVVRFTPNDPFTYPLGSGTYSWYFQGRLHGLTTTGEKIDAYDHMYDDSIFSTSGAAALPNSPILKVADEDLFRWYSWDDSWSASPLDGSTITGLAAEDINGYSYDSWVHDRYITILGPFNLGGIVGDGKSIVQLTSTGYGYTLSLVQWLAPGATFPTTIDAIELVR